MNNQKPVFEYKGKIYVRPMDRGISLKDAPHNGRVQLEDVMPDGDYVIDVKIYKIAKEKEKEDSK